MTSYIAEATRTEGGWMVRVRGVRGLNVAARTLAGAEAHALEALAARLGTSPKRLEFTVHVAVPEPISERLEEALRLSRDADAMRDSAASAWREVATALTAELGLSQQDAATVMGISRQRVGQLLREAEHSSPRLRRSR